MFAFGGISRAANRIYVTFRGSGIKSAQNWAKNVQFTKTKHWSDQPKVKIHKGFSTSWNSMKPYVTKMVSNLKSACKSCSVVVVGHSLGAGLATMATVDLVRGGHRVSLVTLGSPRVGNKDFAAYFKKLRIPTIRWVNKNDLVPQSPPTLMGYAHVAQEYWSKTGTSFKACSSTNGEDKTCSKTVRPWKYSVKDHFTYLNLNYVQIGKPYGCDGVTTQKGPTGLH
jgi:predicted lipase